MSLGREQQRQKGQNLKNAAAAQSLRHAAAIDRINSSFTTMTFRDRHRNRRGGEQGRQVEIRVDKDLPIIVLLGLPSSAVLDLV